MPLGGFMRISGCVLALWATVLAAAPASAETVPFQPVPQNLPKPLSDADAGRYARIFAIQGGAMKSRNAPEWKEADRLIAALDNDLLLGRVLAQRYLHPTGWRSSWPELKAWMERYYDQPSATRIHRLASRRKPKGAKAPRRPKDGYLDGYGRTHPGSRYASVPATTEGRRSLSKTRSIAREVRKRVRSGWPTGARNMLNSANLRYLTGYEEAVLRANIAHGYFIEGKDSKAVAEAKRAIAKAGKSVPQAYWTAGKAAWRAGDIQLAMNFMRVLAENPDAPSNLVSGAGFWASRGALRAGEADESFRYLEIAASRQDTFYGTLAAEALGQDIVLDFSLPELEPAFIRRLDLQPAGRRAFGLLQAGETYHASRELRTIWHEMDLGQQTQLMVLAARTHMAGLAFRTADILRLEHGVDYFAGLYPVPDFDTGDPLRVDHALLLAVMRQESGFNPRARSWAKASGLMQLMPATAAYISRDRRYRDTRLHELLIPETNIRLGQEYILYLLGEKPVEGDLLRLLAAYNGGPGNLRKWMGRIDHGGDALMLLESLPARETRFYVKNVLTNLWIYRKRLGQDSSIIGAIASGIEADYDPRGAHVDGRSCELVRLSHRCLVD